MRLRRRALVCLVAMVAAGPVGGAVADPPPGSKNFETPSNVPNYFSNEAGPFRGETPVPPATPAMPAAPAPAASAPSPVAPAAVAPEPNIRTAERPSGRGGRRHIARGRGRGRVASAHGRAATGRRGGRVVVARGHAPARRAEHVRTVQAQPKTPHAAKAAAKSRSAPAKGKRAVHAAAR